MHPKRCKGLKKHLTEISHFHKKKEPDAVHKIMNPEPDYRSKPDPIQITGILIAFYWHEWAGIVLIYEVSQKNVHKLL